MDVYAIVTNQIIQQLEQGIIPWERPWTGTKEGAYSRTTGKPYSFLNQMLLGRPGEYLTFNQVREAGGHIRKGEKASMVVFYKPLPVAEQNTTTGETETKNVPFLRYYNVFHVDQIDGIEPKYKPAETPDFQPIEQAETIIDHYTGTQHIKVNYIAGNRAFYAPGADMIQVPKRGQFLTAEGFYSTVFHEMTHSTGHKTRLNRLTATAHFGNGEYSKEELVAELGAAYLMNIAHLDSAKKELQNSAAYIQSWLNVLKNDRHMIVSAAGKAEKAVDLILA